MPKLIMVVVVKRIVKRMKPIGYGGGGGCCCCCVVDAF